jgi:hypothetical protein
VSVFGVGNFDNDTALAEVHKFLKRKAESRAERMQREPGAVRSTVPNPPPQAFA